MGAANHSLIRLPQPSSVHPSVSLSNEPTIQHSVAESIEHSRHGPTISPHPFRHKKTDRASLTWNVSPLEPETSVPSKLAVTSS